jgi:hypothetical protein
MPRGHGMCTMLRPDAEPEPIIHLGGWSSAAREEMDARFRAAVLAAVASGTEACVTTPSTSVGIRHPIINYCPSEPLP